MIGRIFTFGDLDPASIAEAIAGKQDLLHFDRSPVAGSNNPVTSDGIATAIAGKQDTLTFDERPTARSRNPGITAPTVLPVRMRRNWLLSQNPR